jgi:hypothetical protein
METRRGGKLLLAGVLVLALASWSTGLVWGAEPPPASPPPEVQQEEAPPEKPEKPPEERKYVPGIPPAVPSTTLTAGPMTGSLAPYGNAFAYDSLARGWLPHRLGAVRVSPYVEFDEIYRTNVFQTSSDKKADWLEAINPGLRVELPLAQQHRLSLGYLGNYFFYNRFSDQSHLDHNVNGEGAFNFPGGLNFRVGTAFRDAVEEATAQNTRQRPYDRVTPYFIAGYKISDRTKLEWNYQYDTLLFKDSIDRINNYGENLASMTFFYKFWPKTAALLQYIFTARDYPDFAQDNNIANTGLIGLTWDPTAKLTGTVKFGYTFKQYDQFMAGRNNSPDAWALSIQTLYRYSRYTNITLIAQRSIQEDSDSNNSPYTNTGFLLTVNHYLHKWKVNTYAGITYYNNAYFNSTLNGKALEARTDNIFGVVAGVSRPLNRWIRLRADYVYQDKTSNFTSFSYMEHKILLGVQAAF